MKTCVCLLLVVAVIASCEAGGYETSRAFVRTVPVAPVDTRIISSPRFIGGVVPELRTPILRSAFTNFETVAPRFSTFEPRFARTFSPAVVTPITKKYVEHQKFELVPDLGRKAFVSSFTPTLAFDRTLPAFQPTFASPIVRTFAPSFTTGVEDFRVLPQVVRSAGYRAPYGSF